MIVNDIRPKRIAALSLMIGPGYSLPSCRSRHSVYLRSQIRAATLRKSLRSTKDFLKADFRECGY